MFKAYGDCCACCGEVNKGFLSIDHVNGGGRAHRRAVGGTLQVLREIAKAGFPPDYQLLCFNCNLGRQYNGGECPHKVGYRFFESESFEAGRRLAWEHLCRISARNYPG